MVSWRFGGDGGLCWAAADDLDHPWWSRETYGFSENKYAVDVLANIVSYTAGRQLPEDIMIPIKIRRELFDYAGAKNLFISTLEFVEKFGADTGPLYEELLDFEERIVEPAKEAYLMGSYAEALETIGAANEEVIRLVDLALEQRKRALFWIFLVEWLVVSGTSMITGTVVWTLMVRRKVYREVGRTRLISD
jgi:hypothetical protein